MNNETVGISTVIVGVIIVVGAVRGTWKKIFNDVISTGSSGGSRGGGFSIPSFGIPNPLNPGNYLPGNPYSPINNPVVPGSLHIPLSYTNPGTSFPQGELIGANGQGMVIY